LPADACRLPAEMATLRPTTRRRTGIGPRSRWVPAQPCCHSRPRCFPYVRSDSWPLRVS